MRMPRGFIMGFVEIQETIRKRITIIKKTIIDSGFDAIIAVPKKEGKLQEKEND